jgi:hypothetical protein
MRFALLFLAPQVSTILPKLLHDKYIFTSSLFSCAAPQVEVKLGVPWVNQVGSYGFAVFFYNGISTVKVVDGTDEPAEEVITLLDPSPAGTGKRLKLFYTNVSAQLMAVLSSHVRRMGLHHSRQMGRELCGGVRALGDQRRRHHIKLHLARRIRTGGNKA